MINKFKSIAQFLPDIFLGIVLPILAVFFLLSPIILPRGIPFYGDETYYIVGSKSFYSTFSPLFTVGNIPLTLVTYSLPLWVFAYLLGSELGVKLFILIVSSLSGVLSYFAIKILAEDFSKERGKKFVRTAAVIGSLLYMVAFSSGILTAASSPIWPYLTFPISLALLIRFLRKEKYTALFFFGIFSVLGNTQSTWLYLMLVPSIIYVIIKLVTSTGKMELLKRVFIALATLFAFNAFWIMPLIAGYIAGAGGVFQSYTTEQLISFEGLRFLSHWNILDVIMIGEHSYNFFWLHPQNYGPLNAIIPILATTSILAFRKKKQVLFTAVVLIIGLFLTKGVHEPGGYLYYLLVKSIPSGAGAILRNPTKFVPLVNFSYAILVGLSVALIYEKLASLKLTGKGLRNPRFLKYGVTISLISLVLVPITYGTLLDLNGYTWPRYKPAYVPSAYCETNDWLLNQQGDFKVMWIPSGGSYVWKPYIITGFPDLLSAKPSVHFSTIYPEPWKSTDMIGRLLSVLGVKYVIYHGDSIDYPTEEELKDIMNQKDLRIVYSSNYTYLPEDNSQKPLPPEQENLQFLNAPFQLNETQQLLRGEETSIVFNYTIPQNVVEQGFEGKFGEGFNIVINGVPAGSNDLTSPIFNAYVYEQTMINETEGYATFKVTAPQNYMGTAVDIYANIYNGGFNPLLPFYFIARLQVSPKEITSPIIVFQNDHYNEPLYTNNLAVAYGFNITDLQKYSQLDPSIWSITSIENISAQSNQLDNAQLFIYSNFSFPQWLNEYIANSNLKLAYILPTSNLNLSGRALSLNVYVPRNGEYTLAVKFNGTLHIAGSASFNGNGEWLYSSNLTLERGNNTIELSTDGEAYIQDIILFSNDQTVPDIFNKKTANLIDYKQISPVKWHATVNSSEPFVLVFTEPYDPLWTAQVNGDRIKPIPLYSMINGFAINQTGTLEITVEYGLQKWFYYGSAVSISTALACIIYLMYRRTKNKKIRKTLNIF